MSFDVAGVALGRPSGWNSALNESMTASIADPIRAVVSEDAEDVDVTLTTGGSDKVKVQALLRGGNVQGATLEEGIQAGSDTLGGAIVEALNESVCQGAVKESVCLQKDIDGSPGSAEVTAGDLAWTTY
jgi:hypothetical protein